MIWTGARKAIHDATAMQMLARSQEASGGVVDRNSMIAALIEAGKVILAVDKQPQAVRDWLYFCYAVDFGKRSKARLERSAFEYAIASVGKVRGEPENVLKRAAAVRMAIEDYRLRSRSAGENKFTITEMMYVIDNSKKTKAEKEAAWWKHYSPVKLSVFEFLEELDARGVTRVAAEMDRMKLRAA